MSNGPFYALLAYVVFTDLRSGWLTRRGFRTLSEKKPPEPKQKPEPPPAAGERREFSGDGYQPKTLADRRTG